MLGIHLGRCGGAARSLGGKDGLLSTFDGYISYNSAAAWVACAIPRC